MLKNQLEGFGETNFNRLLAIQKKDGKIIM